MTAYARAIWQGEVSGPAMWLAVIAAGIVLAGAIAFALTWLVDYLERHEATDAPPKSYLQELAALTDAERRASARFTSLIAVLALLGVPVVALTR